jgi:hypothetical protein
MKRFWPFPRKPKKSGVAVGLGWLSIGLGLVEVFAGRRIAQTLGMAHRTNLVRTFGAREIVNGISILASTRVRPWLWMRVAGDLLDLGVLASALSPRNRRRDDAAIALASVAGITLLDLASTRANQ